LPCGPFLLLRSSTVVILRGFAVLSQY